MRNTLIVVLFALITPGAGSGVQGPGAAVPVPPAPPMAPAPLVPPVPPLPAMSFVTLAPLAPPAPPVSLAAERGMRSSAESWTRLPESFAPQDPADSLWRHGRSLLNRSEYRNAAAAFRQIHTDSRFAGSAYRPGSYYYEALALFRSGSTDELRRGRRLLVEMREQYPRDRQLRDADQLEARIIGALARQGDPEAASALERQASQAAVQEEGPCPDEEDDTRIVALNALLQMNADRAVPILREVLARRDECSAQLRQRAIFVLSQKQTEGIDQVLLEAARSDPDPDVREAAVFWLSQVNTPEAVNALEQILRTSRDAQLQEKALFALSQNSGDRAEDILRAYATRDDIPTELRRNAVFWIAQRPGEANLRFLRELYPRVRDEELKNHILFSIAQSGDAESLDWLVGIALAENASIEVRKTALFHASSQGALPASRLAELYDRGGDREFREHVIFTLSQHSTAAAAVDKLMDIARNDPDTELRNRAIFWLSQSRDPRVADFLLEIINR